MTGSPMEVRRARRTRLVWIVAITIVVEAALFGLVMLAPAMVDLVRPVYWLVALMGFASAWHALRRQPGADRRHADRRHR